MTTTIAPPPQEEKTPFRLALEAAVAGKHSQASPFSVAWSEGRLQRDHFAFWVAQHLHYVGHFSEWLGAMFADCPYKDARDFLLQNMWEEEMGTPHTELLIRFGEACGWSRERILGTPALPTTNGLRYWCETLAKSHDFVGSSAALIVGLESQTPGIYTRQLPPLREKYGFTEDETIFFDVHISSDVVHGERGYQIVEKYADTPDEQERCLDLVHRAAGMRWMYMGGLYQELSQQFGEL
ncbi:MAG: TenA family transcriptional regulator [Acidimicrobiales bacterium]